METVLRDSGSKPNEVKAAALPMRGSWTAAELALCLRCSVDTVQRRVKQLRAARKLLLPNSRRIVLTQAEAETVAAFHEKARWANGNDASAEPSGSL